MALFLLFFAMFFIVTLPARSAAPLQVLLYDPVRLLRTMIILSTVLWLLPLFKHRLDTQYAWYGLYFGAAAMSIWGWWLGTRFRYANVLGMIQPRQAITILVLASTPFFFYYVIGGGLGSDFNALMSSSLYDLRQAHWASFGVTQDWWAPVLGCAAFPAAHIWPLRSPRTPIFWYSLALMMMFIIGSSAVGARATVVFSLAVCYLLLHTRYRLNPIRLIRQRPMLFALLFVVFVALAYYIFYYVLSERAPGLKSEFERMSRHIVGAPPTDLLHAANTATNGVFGVIALNLGYFSSTLTYFGLFVGNMDACACTPQYGVYNFPFLDAFGRQDWFEIRLTLGQFWRSLGVGENPWASAYRDWIIDFGVLGSLLFNLLIFFGLGALARSAASRTDDLAKLVVAFSTAFILMTPLLSPLLLLVVSLPFYGLILAYIFSQAPRVASGEAGLREQAVSSRAQSSRRL